MCFCVNLTICLKQQFLFYRRKANTLIGVVWAIPTFYGLLSMTKWNCTALCTCTLTYRNPALHICQVNDNSKRSTCSSIYTPMAKSYLFVVSIIWLLECFVLVALFIKSLLKVSKFDRSHLNAMQTTKLGSLVSSDSAEKRKNSIPVKRKSSAARVMSKYRKSHQVLLVLFSLFFVCTAPIMTCFAVDYLSTANVHLNSLLVNVLTPLPFLYCLFSPILLLRKLGGLRNATSMLLTMMLTPRKLEISRKKKGKKRSDNINKNNQSLIQS